MIINSIKKTVGFPYIDPQELFAFLKECEFIFSPEDDNEGFKKNFKVSFRDVTGFDSFTAALEKRDLVRIKFYVDSRKTGGFYTVFFLGAPPKTNDPKLNETAEQARTRITANKKAKENYEKFKEAFEKRFNISLTDIPDENVNKLQADCRKEFQRRL